MNEIDIAAATRIVFRGVGFGEIHTMAPDFGVGGQAARKILESIQSLPFFLVLDIDHLCFH